MTSPIHRQPEDGNDYGCFTDEANAKVAALVDHLQGAIEDGTLADGEAVIAKMREELEQIGEGSCDTVVKENVFQALQESLETAGLEIDQMEIYGW